MQLIQFGASCVRDVPVSEIVIEGLQGKVLPRQRNAEVMLVQNCEISKELMNFANKLLDVHLCQILYSDILQPVCENWPRISANHLVSLLLSESEVAASQENHDLLTMQATTLEHSQLLNPKLSHPKHSLLLSEGKALIKVKQAWLLCTKFLGKSLTFAPRATCSAAPAWLNRH